MVKNLTIYYQIDYVSVLSCVNEEIINIIHLLDLVISRKSRSRMRTSTRRTYYHEKIRVLSNQGSISVFYQTLQFCPGYALLSKVSTEIYIRFYHRPIIFINSYRAVMRYFQKHIPNISSIFFI